MSELKLFRNSDIDWVKKLADESLVFSDSIGGRIAEAADGMLTALFVSQLNNFVTPYIPQDIIGEIHDVFDEVKEGDTKGAALEALDVIQDIFDGLKGRIENEKIHPWLDVIVQIFRGLVESF